MRKTCVQPVDGVSMDCENEHYLYSWYGTSTMQGVVNPQVYTSYPHKMPTSFSTAFFGKINLLLTDLSTLYTGLITNTINII